MGKAHHGAAGQHFLGVLRHAASSVNGLTEGGTNAENHILGRRSSVAGDRHNAAGDRFSLIYRLIDGGSGGCVEHGAAHGGGQLARRDLSVGHGLDQLLLRALGVAGGQYPQFDG